MIFIMAVWLHLWGLGAVVDVSGPVSDPGLAITILTNISVIYGLLS